MNTKNKVGLRYSQNFLKSHNLVKRLISKAGLNKKDIVYEIGPGKGIITSQLVVYCKKVIAIEKDKTLHKNLCRKFANVKNVQIIYGDFLKIKLPHRQKYKVFSNIPFSLTSEIISKLIRSHNPPEDMYLIVQREAAVKHAGLPYGPERLRSLMLKPRFELKITHRFKRNDFTPVPNVDAVLLQIKKRNIPILPEDEMQIYQDFISYSFACSSPSKTTIRDVLSKIFTKKQFAILSKNLKFSALWNLNRLSFEQWIGLFKYFLIGVEKNKKRLVLGSSAKLKKQQNKLDKIYRTRRY